MENEIDKKAAEHYLRAIEPKWRGFWFHSHLVSMSLAEFAEALAVIDDGVYEYHAEGHKNDLSRWVREVVGDGILADKLMAVKTREEAIVLVKDRVKFLQQVAEVKS